jgi:hypothetical protein
MVKFVCRAAITYSNDLQWLENRFGTLPMSLLTFGLYGDTMVTHSE